MNKLWLFVFILALPLMASATVTFKASVATNVVAQASTIQTAVVSIATGNTIVVGAGQRSGLANWVTSVTDTIGNSYVKLIRNATVDYEAEQWYCLSSIGTNANNRVTVNWNGSAAGVVATQAAYSGVLSVGVVNTSTTIAVQHPIQITTTQAASFGVANIITASNGALTIAKGTLRAQATTDLASTTNDITIGIVDNNSAPSGAIDLMNVTTAASIRGLYSAIELKGDVTAPKYYGAQENLTLVPEGDAILLAANWTDNIQLNTAILSTNETGAWVNWSGRYGSYNLISGVSSWSNFSWANNTIADGTYISWKIWANDTSGNWNVTTIYNFTTQHKEINEPTIYSPLNGTTYSAYQVLNYSVTGAYASYTCGYKLVPENNQSWVITSANSTINNNTNYSFYIIGLSNVQHSVNVTCWENNWLYDSNKSQSIWNYSVGGSPPAFQNFTNSFTPSKNAQSVYNESTYCGCYASVAAVPFQNYTKSWTPSLSAQSDYQSNDFCGSYSSVSAVPYTNWTNTITPNGNAKSAVNTSTFCDSYMFVNACPLVNITNTFTPSTSVQTIYNDSNAYCKAWVQVAAVAFVNHTKSWTPSTSAQSDYQESAFCGSYSSVSAIPVINLTNVFTPSDSIQTIYNTSAGNYCYAWNQVAAVAFANYTKSFTPSTVAQSNYQSNSFCGSYCDVSAVPVVNLTNSFTPTTTSQSIQNNTEFASCNATVSAVAVTNFTNTITADSTTQTINNNTQFCGSAITVNPTAAPTLVNISFSSFAPSTTAQSKSNTTSAYCNAYAYADAVPVVNLTNTFTPTTSVQSIQNNTAFASCNATVEAIAKVNISIANFVPSTVAQSASNTTIDYCNAHASVDAVPVTNFTEMIVPSSAQQSVWNATEFCSNNATVEVVPFTNFTHSFTPSIIAQSNYQSNAFCGAYSAVNAIPVVNISLGTFTPSLVAQGASDTSSLYCNAYAWVDAVPFTNFSNYFYPTLANQSIYNSSTFCGAYSFVYASALAPVCAGGGISPNMLIIRTQTPIPQSSFPYPH
jgi:hypothetical protein